MKFLGNTATTTRAEVEAFERDVSQILQCRDASRSGPRGVRVDYDPDGWHGYLVYPQYGAANLREVCEMRRASAA
ncbi:hypothetical protein [Blastococcus sp. URHD0036]|uniref:hypothetical protein n=1 Tax=Blastococcus sp. URHD0036 TaxID=1380356 RepID=UPI0012DFA3F8|nr:hypothetical protein [Blastococcus sp. URHD0036]